MKLKLFSFWLIVTIIVELNVANPKCNGSNGYKLQDIGLHLSSYYSNMISTVGATSCSKHIPTVISHNYRPTQFPVRTNTGY